MTIPELAGAWLLAETNAGEVEPFVHAGCIVASYHVPVAHIITEAVGGLLARSCGNSVTLIASRTRLVCPSGTLILGLMHGTKVGC